MLDACNILITRTGHLIVESYDPEALNIIRVLDSTTRANRPIDPAHDYVPVSEIDEGLFWQAYQHWCP